MLIETYFPIPIMRCTVPFNVSLKIKNYIEDNLDKLKEYSDQRTDYFDVNKFFRFEDFSEFHSYIITAKDNYAKNTGINASNRIEHWIQDYNKKEHRHNLHHHGVSGISGTYWVRANANAGAFRFHNPNPYHEYADFLEIDSQFTNSFYDIPPKEGDFILFPSYLKHEVLTAQNNDVVRTCIAFNFVPEKEKNK